MMYDGVTSAAVTGASGLPVKNGSMRIVVPLVSSAQVECP